MIYEVFPLTKIFQIKHFLRIHHDFQSLKLSGANTVHFSKTNNISSKT